MFQFMSAKEEKAHGLISLARIKLGIRTDELLLELYLACGSYKIFNVKMRDIFLDRNKDREGWTISVWQSYLEECIRNQWILADAEGVERKLQMYTQQVETEETDFFESEWQKRKHAVQRGRYEWESILGMDGRVIAFLVCRELIGESELLKEGIGPGSAVKKIFQCFNEFIPKIFIEYKAVTGLELTEHDVYMIAYNMYHKNKKKIISNLHPKRWERLRKLIPKWEAKVKRFLEK